MNTRRKGKVKIGNGEVKDEDEFVYLGPTVTKDGGGTEEIMKPLNKARRADEDLENTDYLPEHENQTVQDDCMDAKPRK